MIVEGLGIEIIFRNAGNRSLHTNPRARDTEQLRASCAGSSSPIQTEQLQMRPWLSTSLASIL